MGASKTFKATTKLRKEVILHVACGMGERDLAAVIGCGRSTLREHFADELATGRARKTAENNLRLDAAAEAGNVSAMKHLAAIMSGQQPAQGYVGKKQLQDEAAKNAGGPNSDWGDDLRAAGFQTGDTIKIFTPKANYSRGKRSFDPLAYPPTPFESAGEKPKN